MITWKTTRETLIAHNNSFHTGRKNNISEDMGTSVLLLAFSCNCIPCAEILPVTPNTGIHTSATCPPVTEPAHEAELKNGRWMLEQSAEEEDSTLELTKAELEILLSAQTDGKISQTLDISR